MASQIQGLKKVAAANRNKTKSQMRDTNNQAQNLNNSVQVQSSNQNNIISSQNIVSSQDKRHFSKFTTFIKDMIR